MTLCVFICWPFCQPQDSSTGLIIGVVAGVLCCVLLVVALVVLLMRRSNRNLIMFWAFLKKKQIWYFSNSNRFYSASTSEMPGSELQSARESSALSSNEYAAVHISYFVFFFYKFFVLLRCMNYCFFAVVQRSIEWISRRWSYCCTSVN